MDPKLITFAAMISFSIFVNGANILIILPLPAPSHINCFAPMFEELANRGHNLTIASPIAPNVNMTYTHLDMNGVQKDFPVSFAVLRTQTRFENMLYCFELIRIFVKGSLQHPSMQILINLPEDQFDLVITEAYYFEAYFAFGRKFKAPVIGLVPQSLPHIYHWWMGDVMTYSYIPNMYLPYTDEMDFSQRLVNAFFGIAHILVYEIYYFWANQRAISKFFPFLDNSDLKSIIKNDLSMIFVNSHHSLGYSKPTVPNVIELAGIHLRPPKPLPVELQIFMDEAEQGVVYISLGSMVDPLVVEEWGSVITKVFENSSVRVIWKWKRELLKNIPNNFMVEEWYPQYDILRHQNCRLFISHGGIHSLIESLNNAVPVIGIPFFSDQHYNIALFEKYGAGVVLLNVEEHILNNAVNRVLLNSSYHENARIRSKLFKDRLTSPLETSVYWVEHVIRYRGAEHLKSMASKLPWYTYLMLDIYLIYCSATIFVIYLLLKVITVTKQLLLRVKSIFSFNKYLPNRKFNGIKVD